MKKFMKMAMVAAMTMVMSNNAMAAENPVPDTYETRVDAGNTSTIRVMVHMNGADTNKFEYTLDNDGRVTSKTMFRYDKNTNNWMPVMKYSAEYGAESNTLSFAAYNKKEGRFNNHEVTTTYSVEDCPVLISLPECINY